MDKLEKLRKVPILKDLDEEMLMHLLSISEWKIYGEDQPIFLTGGEASYLYILIRGKALLELSASEDIVVSFAALKTGYVFGWSSLVQDGRHQYTATSSEESEIVRIPGDKIRHFMDENCAFGYRLLKNLYALLNDRLHLRTEQFLAAVASHPDIKCD